VGGVSAPASWGSDRKKTPVMFATSTLTGPGIGIYLTRRPVLDGGSPDLCAFVGSNPVRPVVMT